MRTGSGLKLMKMFKRNVLELFFFRNYCTLYKGNSKHVCGRISGILFHNDKTEKIN